MTASSGPWLPLLEDVRRYPSPHNSQPIRVRVIDAGRADVFYDLDRGLPAENFGIPFGHVCAGVFLESLRVVAAAAGYRVDEALELEEMDFSSPHRLHRLGTVTLEPQAPGAEDPRAAEAFRMRRTNRRPYDDRAVPRVDLEEVQDLAAGCGQRFSWSGDARVVAPIIRINQETLFDDLRNDAVYAEIMEWLRFTEHDAIERGDGLSAAAMLMPGPLLRFAMGHRGLWQAPVIGAAIRGMYLRTMRGVRQLAWFEGPFAGPSDYVEAGRVFMRCWLELTARGVSLHPFGTVITNPRSHARFVDIAGADESDGRMAWMLVRLGYAKTPPVAHRRPLEEMLVA
ncbi:hypothetical protein [Demequina maris]|uniref:hypothetical protein n=1 Tax=Demequina maris TaxID=1638982 RepID=UPI000781E545|nr:hypothetical protein [Demequina maris]